MRRRRMRSRRRKVAEGECVTTSADDLWVCCFVLFVFNTYIKQYLNYATQTGVDQLFKERSLRASINTTKIRHTSDCSGTTESDQITAEHKK